MDRNLHKKFVPPCKRNPGIVDQYSWEQKDTNKYMCTNGVSHPIYDCKGWVNYSLPLELYPPASEVHPQIEMTRRMHLNWRGSPNRLIELKKRYNHSMEEHYKDLRSGRSEGLYSNGLTTSGCSSCN